MNSLFLNQLIFFLFQHTVSWDLRLVLDLSIVQLLPPPLVINNIICALDRGESCAALFVDLLKAFNTTNHSFLSSHLCDIGCDSNASWFQYYLNDRKQSDKHLFASWKMCSKRYHSWSSCIYSLYQQHWPSAAELSHPSVCRWYSFILHCQFPLTGFWEASIFFNCSVCLSIVMYVLGFLEN